MLLSEGALLERGRLSPKHNYDVRFIKKVVDEIEHGLPRHAAMVKYGVKKITLASWLRHHSSAEYRKTRKKTIPAQQKRSIVRAIRAGHMTITEAMAACNIKAAHTIKEWIVQEKDDLADANLTELSKKKPVNHQQSSAADIKALQQQLTDAQLKIAALNTLIDVAEEQLKINIRKKPGARQS